MFLGRRIFGGGTIWQSLVTFGPETSETIKRIETTAAFYDGRRQASWLAAIAKKRQDYFYLPHSVHTGHTGFSDIEIKRVSLGGVADIAVVMYAHPFIPCSNCFVAKPVKPHAVGVMQAARLALVHRHDAGLWCDLYEFRRRPTLEPHERVIAFRCYRDHTHTHTHTLRHRHAEFHAK